MSQIPPKDKVLTRVDFYQLNREPVELIVSQLADKATTSGARVLVVCPDAGRRLAISDALWAFQGQADNPAFLAHGLAGEGDEARQPILVSGACDPLNGATIAILADGEWRAEVETLERAMLLFGPARTDAARKLWRELAAREDIETHIFKQDGLRWREGR